VPEARLPPWRADELDRAVALLLALTGLSLVIWGGLAAASHPPPEGLLYLVAGAAAFTAAHGVHSRSSHTPVLGLVVAVADFLAPPFGAVSPLLGVFLLAYFAARWSRFPRRKEHGIDTPKRRARAFSGPQR